MSECWQISGGGVSNDDADSVHSDGHETAFAGTDNQRNANIDCYNCGKKGHYARDILEDKKGGNQTVVGPAKNAAYEAIGESIAGNRIKVPLVLQK